MKNYRIALLPIILALASPVLAQAPHINPETDSEHLGSPDDILFWAPDQKVAGFRNIHRMVPVRRIQASENPFPLPQKLLELGNAPLQNSPPGMTVESYLEQQSVAGLLVLKNGEIVYERYRLGNDASSRWLSFSVTKSVTSLLLGAAIQDGYIKSVDEAVTAYLPRLQGSAYDEASIRNILQMASGVEWDENYADPEADINQVSWNTLSLYDYLAAKPSSGKPGIAFNYNTAETNLVGTLLRSAIGNNLSTYLEEKIWKPFGMEADAYWSLTEPGGGEFGGCCINATLRDYGRLGLFALSHGRLRDGTAVLPPNWMAESLEPSQGTARYGYLWWLGEGGVFEASGIFGQGILVNPAENLVIALHSARPHASRKEDWALQSEFYKAITRAVHETGDETQ